MPSTSQTSTRRWTRWLSNTVAVALVATLLAGLTWTFANPDLIHPGQNPTLLDRLQAWIDGREEPSFTTTANTYHNDVDAFMEYVTADFPTPAQASLRSRGGFHPLFPHHPRPYHWCADTTITWHLDARNARAAGRTPSVEARRWKEAFARWSTASGGTYRFVRGRNASATVTSAISGRTTVAPDSIPLNGIVVSYATSSRRAHPSLPVRKDMLTAQAVGGAHRTTAEGHALLQRGFVVANADANTPVNERMYVHEVGHALGLGHVNNPAHVMYSEADGTAHISSGDTRGIRYLASLTCQPSP